MFKSNDISTCRQRQLDQLLHNYEEISKNGSIVSARPDAIMRVIIEYFVRKSIIFDITGVSVMSGPVGIIYHLDRHGGLNNIKSYTTAATSYRLSDDKCYLIHPRDNAVLNQPHSSGARYADGMIHELARNVTAAIESIVLMPVFYSAKFSETLTSYNHLSNTILAAAHNIGKRCGCPGNFMLVTKDMLYHIINSNYNLFEYHENNSIAGRYVGIDVYVHHPKPNDPIRQCILVGYKNGDVDTGAHFMSYTFIPPIGCVVTNQLDWNSIMFRGGYNVDKASMYYELIPVKIA